LVKVWAVGQGWDLGRGQGWDLGLDLAKALVAALVGWPPDVELLAAGLALPVVECVLVVGLAPPGVGWALAVVKDWELGVAKACRQVPLPGCV
jgi:hypothetical protein